MSDSDLLLEICVDCLESIRNAIDGGAGRLELCSALSEGGLTPSTGLAKIAKRISSIPIFAMIRIRGGDFVYDPDELDAMLHDVEALKNLGINGFVFGALTSTSEIDIESCRKIIAAAKPLPVTFHRAFDDAINPYEAFDEIRNLGFSRLLTSGQEKRVDEGVDLIAKLVKLSNNEVIVMPGAGLNENNISSVRNKTGAEEFHGSAKKIKAGKAKIAGDGGATVTDPEIVRRMATILKKKL
ncbi:copper homeostasis protein cutC homolog [Phymastichus coffea]|uniref:copper homeostasis protein cutC homolog n=1 Tax=Phymastichus coffea TaxID=108790 RepID=UPI00273C3E93|nr:copper homeostasis protein cutC homolog [Phymastichus coffea]